MSRSESDATRIVRLWLEEGVTALPDRVLDAVLDQLPATSQRRPSWLARRTPNMNNIVRLVLAAAAVVVVALIGYQLVNLLPGPNVGSEPSPSAEPSLDLVSFDLNGGFILGTSSDGTWLLISRGDRGEQRMFVLHADGSETQVTDRPMSIWGVTFAPDGSRVAFVGREGEVLGPLNCCSGDALYAVDRDGGPAEVLVVADGRVEWPAFSPDGSWVAYVDGAGDNSHHVRLIRPDGSGAHEIFFQDCACHVNSLGWSPAGDRLTLVLEGTSYSFASDGSDLRPE